MADAISDVAAFVIRNGAMAEALLFGDEIPGLTVTERDALNRVESHLEQTWVGLLDACREALWVQAKGHRLRRMMGRSRNRKSTIWNNEEVACPLVLRTSWEASCGISLKVWEGDPRFILRTWCWTQARHRQTARDATRGVEGVRWNGSSHWSVVQVPAEGDRYADLAEKAAANLWEYARPIGEAVLATKKK